MLKKSRRPAQEINSSSMADIAFLLLIFFLVTTTISMDKGISLVLPSEGNELEVNRKNIVNILMNESGKVLLDDKAIRVNDIKGIVERKIARNPNLIFSSLKTVRLLSDLKFKNNSYNNNINNIIL